MLIPYLSNEGIAQIEANIGEFVNALKMQAIKQDPTWQMVLWSFCFQTEIKIVQSYLSEQADVWDMDTSTKEYFMKEIKEALNKNEGEFDL